MCHLAQSENCAVPNKKALIKISASIHVHVHMPMTALD